MSVPPKIFSGYNFSRFDPALQYIYDASISGYRAITAADLAGAGVTVTGVVTIDQVGISGGFVTISGGPVKSQNAATGDFVTIGFELANPTGLPASGSAGTVRRGLADLQGLPFAHTPDLNRSYDNLTVWPATPIRVSSTGLANRLIISASGNVTIKSIEGYISGAANRYLQLHDNSGVPSANAVPFDIGIASAGERNFQFYPSDNGYPVLTGCTLVVSSTPGFYTAVVPLEMFATATYINT